jgi:UDP-N-acetylmuramoyl-tripeptide--D-alanyl-D-alanine ligase
MKDSVIKLLAYLSRKIISKYHPLIIAITGSVGKTSAKEAIFDIVSQKYKSRKPEKNFNNELGLPLTILGTESPGRNPFAWLYVLAKGTLLIISKQPYPEVLVLEMGIDRPGDMNYLLKIVRPNIAVITNIGLSHYEYFKDEAVLENEKGKLAQAVLPGGTVIVNADNSKAFAQKSKTSEKSLSYGAQSLADVQISGIQEQLNPSLGITTTFSVKTPTRKFSVTANAVGTPHISSLAAAVAVAESLGMETALIAKGIKQYKPAPGRLNVIWGIKKTIIIDDTYNAAPDSMKAALEVLGKFPGKEKIAILGDMLELGKLSNKAHMETGNLAAKLGLRKLITVGPSGKIIAAGALAAGMDANKIVSFDLASQTHNVVQSLLMPEAVILIKGSQGMRMETITKEIMAEPMRAGELLCRQYGKWVN